MAAFFDDSAQCLSRAGARPLLPRSRSRPRSSRCHDAPAFPDAIERRRHAARRRSGNPHRTHLAFRTGGRRARRGLPARGTARPRQYRDDGHGRHELRHRLRRKRRSARANGRVDRPSAGRRSGPRCRDDSGGRRQSRLRQRRRHARRRSAERRRRAGPGLLRPRRNAADRHRRRPRLRSAQSRLLSRRRDASRQGGGDRGRRTTPSRSRWEAMSRRPPAASCASSMRASPTRSVSRQPNAASISPGFTLVPFGGAGPVHAAQRRPRSRHPTRARAAPSRRLLGARSVVHATSCTTTCARNSPTSPRSTRSIARIVSPTFASRACEEFEAEGLDPAQAVFFPRDRPALCRAGLRIARLAGLSAGAARRRRARRRRRAVSRSARRPAWPLRAAGGRRGGELSAARAGADAEIRTLARALASEQNATAARRARWASAISSSARAGSSRRPCGGATICRRDG